MEKVTYETFTPDATLAREFTRAVTQVGAELGAEHPFYVDAYARTRDALEPTTAPHDSRLVLGHFAQATPADLDDAITAAHAFFAEWDDTPWPERVEIVARVSTLVAARRFELAAILAYEAGKPLLEALGEVDECVELVDYYCAQMRANEGFNTPMGAPSERERAYSVLRPYGVWAVIGPFNFPMALTLGPIAAALIAGNTVVFKPSPHGYLSAHAVYRLFIDAGLPAPALHLLTIPDQQLGTHLYTHPRLGGLTFTGSYATGMRIYRGFTATQPRPAICEMGGKNPALVTAHADLTKAAAGIARSAFGYAGQRCSACSRAFVVRPLYDELLAGVLHARERVLVGSPLDPATEIGPTIAPASVQRLLDASAECRTLGFTVHGGHALGEDSLAHGHYAEPTVAEVPADARVMRDELFTPFVGITAVDSFEHALELANSLSYGLTAGLYSEHPAEIEHFVQRIAAGVVYVNRAAGATSGAWPGVQPFGGWKASGNTGRGAGGLHYLQQYMREQSRTFVR